MATAAVARPANALRRRDAPRPSVNKRNPNMDPSEQGPNKRKKLEEPYVRDTAFILKKHRGKPPSLIIHLHQTHFRFEGQDGSWAYDSAMKFVLEHLRSSTVPHEMLEELLSQNVPWYDGCLIVEVHNHRGAAGKEKSRNDSGVGDDTVKFSMNNYTEHVTPSPFAPFPAKAKAEDPSNKPDGANGEMPAPERPNKEKEQDGPKITTIVLHPTQLSKYHDQVILFNTSASELRSKKKGSDSTTPSSAQPPTPQLSVPPTPTNTSRGPLSQTQRMALEEGDLYTFQAEVLVATEPPLFLDPVDNPEDSDKIIKMLGHPQHQEKPPSPKTRKRTTAEMAADDAQAAEAERRMLIMDERLKPSARAGTGAAGNENQSTAASLGFSRFKTLEMVRQKHEEQERIKKDEEARAALERKQAEEQNAANAAQQAHQKMMQQQQLEIMRQRQQAQRQQNLLLAQRQQEQQRQQQIAEAQRQQAMAREHAHPAQNQMMPNNQQANFQHPASMAQNSPIARQQTPMLNTSPMMPNGEFGMVQTSSQGAGSPQRPTSAAMQQNRNAAMARQASQQQHGSQNNTPQIPQGTPSMSQAMPNRQITQTPLMGSASPAVMHGTPTSASVMPMATPQMAANQQQQQLQIEMMQRAMQQQNQQGQQNMSPAEIQNMQNQNQQRQQQIQLAQQQALLQRHMAQNPNDPRLRQMKEQFMRQQVTQARQQQMQQMMQMNGQAGSPGGMHGQATPQMGHAHPQTPRQPQQLPNGVPANATQEQLMEAHRRAQHMQATRQAQLQLNQIGQPYGGWQNIPPPVAAQLPQPAKLLLQQQLQNQSRQRQMAAQAARMSQGGGGGGGGGQQVVPGGSQNPEYMNQLRQNQAEMLARIQHQQPGAAGAFPGGMAMNVNMGNGMPNGNFASQMGGNDSLSQHFAQMQNALQRNQQGGGGGGGGQGGQ